MGLVMLTNKLSDVYDEATVLGGAKSLTEIITKDSDKHEVLRLV